MNPTKTEAIKRFLLAKTHLDLASLYNHDMEVQVNVAQDGGSKIDREYKGRAWSAWSDGVDTWNTFRIPYKAYSTPEYTDSEIKFDLARHAEGIGMTGWDWKSQVSRWVAFDFDAITGHSIAHQQKLTDSELREVAAQISKIPWATLRRSTSGKGLHVYVFVPEIRTQNHHEHAALARSILGLMSAITAFDFNTKVDARGAIMWVWHRKMLGTNGLELLKAGTRLNEIPPNWKDHIEVVSGKRRKILPQFIKEIEIPESDRLFEELTGQRTRVPLDAEHQKLIEWLRESNNYWWWNQEHWMLVTHTASLKEAHNELGLRGLFETLATGREAGRDHNCFAFPMRRGAWAIRRYSPGVAESGTWEQDGAGWTRCYLNREPDLPTAARAFEGIEHPHGGYVFRHAEQAKKAAELLGCQIELPPWIMTRKTTLKARQDGRINIEIDLQSDDAMAGGLPGWIAEKTKWKRVFDAKIADPIEAEVGQYDDFVRHLVSSNGDDFGWVIKSDAIWRNEPLVHVRASLEALGFNPKEAKMVVGSSVFKPYTLVNIPFEDEFPKDRQWNRNAARLRFQPSENVESLTHPHWDKVLNHCGFGLNDAIKRNAWAKLNGVTTGGEYLKCWLASLFQNPQDPLPYVFFYGMQDSGKSVFHEAIRLLVTRGIARADTALTTNFNGELANSILCIVEETDLRNNPSAYNKIKDWVTSREMSIHAKGQTPYLIPNTTHWVQCANDHLACPIFPGDTRITMINVPDLDAGEMIPKKHLIMLLEKEAPDFIAAILNLEIPASPDRLGVPVIITDEKATAEAANRNLLEQFIGEMCHHVPGELLKFGEFYDRFKNWLDPQYVYDWSKIKVGRHLPPKYPKGRIASDGGQFYIGNISFTPKESVQERLVVRNEKLVPFSSK